MTLFIKAAINIHVLLYYKLIVFVFFVMNFIQCSKFVHVLDAVLLCARWGRVASSATVPVSGRRGAGWSHAGRVAADTVSNDISHAERVAADTVSNA